MPKPILLGAIFSIVFFYSCKKLDPTTIPPNNATANLEAKLEAGNGTWQLGTSVLTFYDKNNVVLKTVSITNTDYWVFSKTEYSGTDYACYDYKVLNDPTTITAFPYSLSQENGDYYMTTSGNGVKYKFQVLTTTNISLVTSDVSLLSFYNGNTLITADHATMADNLVKYP